MSGVEILMIVTIVLQLIAAAIALMLIRETKYSALWISCIITLLALSTERIMQLLAFDGHNIPPLTYAWVGILVSVGISISVICARLLVNHVDRMSHHRRLLENRLLTAVLRTEERSRASFSRELHDGLGPLLSSAKMSLSSLSKSELNDKERLTLQNTVAVIDEAIRSLREISNNLSPHVLNSFGLVRGIKNFVDRSVALHDVTIEFVTPLRDERFDSNIEVIIYRVICELINNSLKHSSCTTINISLKLNNGRIAVVYSDNGCGFSYKESINIGMGLSNMKSRISSLGGSLRFNSKPGCGMSAYFEVSENGNIPQPAKRKQRRIKRLERHGKKN